jgi:hypothetical protein
MNVRHDNEDGSAILEFLIIGVLVLVPLLYIMLTVLRVESAVMASTQAAREAGRAFMMADSTVAMSDQGFEMPESALSITCSQACLSPASTAHVRIDWRVELPWVPTFLIGDEQGYPITVDSELRVDSYRSDVSS